MSEVKVPVTTQPATDPSVFKVLENGTVLYKTWQQAESAKQQQQAAQRQDGTTVRTLSQARLGQSYLAKEGTVTTCNLGNLVEFQFTGLIVVILVLSGLSILCAVIGRFIRRLETGTAAAVTLAVPPPAVVPAASPRSVEPGIHPGLTDQQLVVLLTAAASEVLGGPVRVDKFRPLTARDLNWSAQGRSQLHTHRLK